MGRCSQHELYPAFLGHRKRGDPEQGKDRHNILRLAHFPKFSQTHWWLAVSMLNKYCFVVEKFYDTRYQSGSVP
jgi:hypothetical protein